MSKVINVQSSSFNALYSETVYITFFWIEIESETAIKFEIMTHLKELNS